ncbi:hydantoinase B/oxoprolinase family protein (plasmid) [Aminobacter sp. SR38]|jgi:N-methylhydantoinase B|uniref:hydantoinase B/oxoprolinase family protein n=1 Tax=Aminobacter sp. SR38 TaxID=2774562 RepID=UPI001780BC78|nr:hydantoinase B/oxoprolinase family protein [Aminobacter sp. SR38]QOF75502.1 hydantoinase B/oxoprolinase family protein [Aminobacter sp. SR38]
MTNHDTTLLDPITLSVMANRLDSIVREMSNTLLRSARSAVINVARDFSCAIVTGENELLAIAEGLPVHSFGAHIQARSMVDLHPQLRDGDAFLHNDPYLGNTHAADHTLLVPVFVEGEHLFTVSAKAHQADIGNSIPTTYFAEARDVYQEGAVIFPCVLVQREGKDIDDVIRMCRKRIRVPEQWYGDYLAGIGAARTGERRLKEFAQKYGIARVRTFVRQWLDYSERRMADAIKALPEGTFRNSIAHDPTPAMPSGIPVNVAVTVNPEQARIVVDLRDNMDCVDCGLNQSEATAINNAVTGVFNCIDWDIPHNSGSLRRVHVLLRENCVVGIPQFPHSCSMSTTNLADRIINVTQSALAKIGDGFGLAEGGNAIGTGMAVVSGQDRRRDNDSFINQLFLSTNGGPASPSADGWVTFCLPCCGGLIYRDSVELDELKMPIHIETVRLVPDTGGAGRFRGAPGTEVIYGPKDAPITVVVPSDGQLNPPRGVWGGKDGAAASTYRLTADGQQHKLPNVVVAELKPGERIRGLDNGGGGYGNPLERDPDRVFHDVKERWVTIAAAKEIYGVEFSGSPEDGTLQIDQERTAIRRSGQSTRHPQETRA